jgi:predicted patatin/cPLA2 family phospholipase
MRFEDGGLILEGGGLRGIYTSGVLHFFMENEIYLPYVIGVSMGACNGANYVSRQPDRNRIVNTRFVNDPRYLSYFRLLFRGELFGMKFIFDTIPHVLVPFDFETFTKSPVVYITGVTDCLTGEALYYEKKDLGDDCFKILQASCSLPFMAKPVCHRGRTLMDGGLSDSVPIRKSIDDGNKKNVLVLTRPQGYRKKRPHFMPVVNLRYGKLKGLCRAIANRHVIYNETMDLIDELEKKDEVFVIRPASTLRVGRAERNKEKLYAAYDQGVRDADACYSGLISYLTGARSVAPRRTV